MGVITTLQILCDVIVLGATMVKTAHITIVLVPMDESHEIQPFQDVPVIGTLAAVQEDRRAVLAGIQTDLAERMKLNEKVPGPRSFDLENPSDLDALLQGATDEPESSEERGARMIALEEFRQSCQQIWPDVDF